MYAVQCSKTGLYEKIYRPQTIIGYILSWCYDRIGLRDRDIVVPLMLLLQHLIHLSQVPIIAFCAILVVRYMSDGYGLRVNLDGGIARRPLSLVLSFLLDNYSVIVYFIARMALPQLVHSMSIIVASSPQLYTDFKLGCSILQRRFQWHLTRHLWTRLVVAFIYST